MDPNKFMLESPHNNGYTYSGLFSYQGCIYLVIAAVGLSAYYSNCVVSEIELYRVPPHCNKRGISGPFKIKETEPDYRDILKAAEEALQQNSDYYPTLNEYAEKAKGEICDGSEYEE